MYKFFIKIFFINSVFGAEKTQKEFDPAKTQCPREAWLMDEDVVCSKGKKIHMVSDVSRHFAEIILI